MYKRVHVYEDASVSVSQQAVFCCTRRPDLGHICRQAGAMVMCGWRRVLEEC